MPRMVDRLAAELEELRGLDQFRSLEELSGVNLCSNDYLGLSAHPELRWRIQEAVASADRVGSTGSRLLSGHSRRWEDLESEFAEFAGTPEALYFGSGYAANVGLLAAILRPSDIVFSDRLNHASIIDGIRLSGARKVVYPHLSLDVLESELKRHGGDAGHRLVVTESVFSMEGDVVPLSQIFALTQEYGAELVIDEAHATAVHGPGGRGLAAQAGIQGDVLAVVHTCGKALASAGAFVCSGATLKHYLVNRARPFLFTTALPPYFAGQVRAALAIARTMDAERARLAALGDALRQGLREADFDTGNSSSQIVPVMMGENALALRYTEGLQRAGFAVRAVRPPTVPVGTARLRLSLTCRITPGQISLLVSAMRAASEQLRHEGSARYA